eukprot:TRINITY_DN10304_c0_g1_i2.p1 TRINITY_DN10304_c0_g1~~TRINITY_DN10304_c0_g1_i2.p1  ORF type:complete len:677 (+),score=132.20 TRINITY_DN10304_c0_g1_i2:1123-3153(+)
MSFAYVLKSGKLPEPSISPEDKPLYFQLKRFALNPQRQDMIFSPALSSKQRQRVHVLARLFGLNHKSHSYWLDEDNPKRIIPETEDKMLDAEEHEAGKRKAVRCVKVWKPSPSDHHRPRRTSTASATASMAHSESQRPARSLSPDPRRDSRADDGKQFKDKPRRRHRRAKSGDQRHLTVTSHDPHDHVVKELLSALPDRPGKMSKEERSIYNELYAFLKNGGRGYRVFADKSPHERRVIHEIAETMGLHHESQGQRGKDRRLVCRVPTDAERRDEAEGFAMVQQALEAYKSFAKQQREELGVSDTSLPPGFEEGNRRHIRYASWNIEWFGSFFKSDTEFHTSVPSQGIEDANNVLERIGCVITALDPDLLAIQEGPGTPAQMELFVERYLDNQYQVLGGLEKKERQQLYYLVRHNGPLHNAHVFQQAYDFLAAPWMFDVEGNLELQEYNYIRVPLIIQADVEVPPEALEQQAALGSRPAPLSQVPCPSASDYAAMSQDLKDKAQAHCSAKRRLTACTFHAKSKFVSGGERKWTSSNDADKQEYIRASVRNRRRIIGECLRLRECLNKFVFGPEAHPLLVVSGDLNAGPGFDFFERLYCLSSGLDALMGSPFNHNKMLDALLIRSRFVDPSDMWTCIFDDFIDEIPNKKSMIDHICPRSLPVDQARGCVPQRVQHIH